MLKTRRWGRMRQQLQHQAQGTLHLPAFRPALQREVELAGNAGGDPGAGIP